MPISMTSLWRSLLVASALLIGAGGASAQTLKVEPADAAPAAAPAPAQQGGIKGANIFEIAPDADKDPNYANQTNAERKQVQPGNNAPMWRDVGQGGVTGTTSLPYLEYGNLVQGFVQYPGSAFTTAGEAWRQVRNNWIIPYGGSLLLIAGVALALFYFGKGTIQLHGKETGRVIERFTYVERAAHWVNAIAFVVLAISGIVMAFGKFFLLPVMGSTLFGWLTYALKNVHNFVGPVFAVSLAVVFFTFLKDNWPSKEDVQWVLKAGGLFGKDRVPERYAAYVARRVPAGRLRLMVGHCDAAADGQRVLDALRERLSPEQSWLVETGSAVGAHAGPGALVVSVQPLS